MITAGIICEYNPFHLGHAKQLRLLRERIGSETAVVCVMSGNFVQRGEPAVFDKFVRSRAAVVGGADLVLELPITCALSSAEGFARGGVDILCRLGAVDVLCFGSEHGDVADLKRTAQLLLSPAFDEALRDALKKRISFASARAEAVRRLGGDEALLLQPNDILAVEYCKAVEQMGGSLEPISIRREGGYHDERPDPENPSATALRSLLSNGGAWEGYVPPAAADIFRCAPHYAMAFGERAVLARLRTLNDEAFRRLPFGTEGLWSKFMRACRTESTVEAILRQTKSKRYAYARLSRMLMCAYLGLTAEDLRQRPPYVRVLAFNDTGRSLLRSVRDHGNIQVINAGETPADTAYYAMERRAADLYALFAEDENRTACGLEDMGRVFYAK